MTDTPTTPRETAARKRLEVALAKADKLEQSVAVAGGRLDKQRAQLHLAILERDHALASPHLEAGYVRDLLDTRTGTPPTPAADPFDVDDLDANPADPFAVNA